MLGTEKMREQEKEGEKQRESGTLGNILYVQEVVIHFILVTYYIKGVTTSWTHSIRFSVQNFISEFQTKIFINNSWISKDNIWGKTCWIKRCTKNSNAPFSLLMIFCKNFRVKGHKILLKAPWYVKPVISLWYFVHVYFEHNIITNK